jgi:hypothetical protein
MTLSPSTLAIVASLFLAIGILMGFWFRGKLKR